MTAYPADTDTALLCACTEGTALCLLAYTFASSPVLAPLS